MSPEFPSSARSQSASAPLARWCTVSSADLPRHLAPRSCPPSSLDTKGKECALEEGMVAEEKQRACPLASWIMPSGHEVWLRPLVPADAQALEEAFHTLPSDVVRARFFHAAKHIPLDVLRELHDTSRRIVLGLTSRHVPGRAQILAVADGALHPETGVMEIGIVVPPPLARQGIGAWMLEWLGALASQKGITTWHAITQRENTAMQHLGAHVGMQRTVDPDDATLVQLRGPVPTCPPSTPFRPVRAPTLR